MVPVITCGGGNHRELESVGVPIRVRRKRVSGPFEIPVTYFQVEGPEKPGEEELVYG